MGRKGYDANALSLYVDDTDGATIITKSVAPKNGTTKPLVPRI